MRSNPVLAIVLVLIITTYGSSAESNNLIIGSGESGTILGTQSISDPGLLSIGVMYSGSVGAGERAYYKFITGSHAFTHTIRLNSTTSTFTWNLYTDPGYTTLIKTCTSHTCTSQTLDSNTAYYLELIETGLIGDNYTIKVDANIQSEGAQGSPVIIETGTPYLGVVRKKSSTFNGESYYAFTTNQAGHYGIALTGASTDIKWALYRGDYESGPVNDCDDIWDTGDESCSTLYLTENTLYYLTVENAGAVDTFFTVTINEGASPPSSGVNQGTLQNPLALAINQAQTVTVAASGISYYKFTTGDIASTYVLRFDRVSSSYTTTLYSDPEFSDKVRSCQGPLSTYTVICYSNSHLDPNRTYYLSLDNNRNVGDVLSMSILEDKPRSPDSEGTELTPINLTVGELYAGKAGAMDVSIYTFTATEATGYRISVTGGTNDLGWTTFHNRTSTLPETICHPFTSANQVCITHDRFDVGKTVHLYVRNYDEVNPDTYNILIESVIDRGEGTPNTPIVINPGDVRTGIVLNDSAGYTDEYNFFGLGRNYYSLKTGSSYARYQIALTNILHGIEWKIALPDNIFFSEFCSDYINSGEVICTTPVLKPDTEYAIEVSNFISGNDSSPFTLSISNEIPIVELTIGVEASDVVDGNDNFGYFKFTTGYDNSIPYTVSVLNSNRAVDWKLYPDIPTDPYSNGIKFCDGIGVSSPYSASCTITTLTPDTTYYLRTSISKPYGVIASYDVIVNEGGGNEGSQLSPIPLSLPASYSGSVADDGVSFYQFTTAKGGPKIHDIGLSDLASGANWHLYSDPGYTELVDYCMGSVSNGILSCATPKLKARTTYYLSVAESGGHSTSFTLNISSR